MRDHVTHVALAFMDADLFNEDDPSEWRLFASVEETRKGFSPGTKIMVAIGGWGQTSAFSVAAQSDESRKKFARNIAKMVEDLGADGRWTVILIWPLWLDADTLLCCQGSTLIGNILGKAPNPLRSFVGRILVYGITTC